MFTQIKEIIPEGFKEILRENVYKVIKPPFHWHQKSYSQMGEDRVLSYLFYTMGISNPSYLDIGANEPIVYSNTYLFYERGSTGVCVDADPIYLEKFSKFRERDKCLNFGISFDEKKEADFYIFSIPALNTLSKDEAEIREKNGDKIERIIRIKLKTINEIIEENFDTTPDLISIDVEGLDLEILKSLDFSKHRPLAICAETLTYSRNRIRQKITEILDYLISQGYFIYADMHVNTIFVDEKKFNDPNTVFNLW